MAMTAGIVVAAVVGTTAGLVRARNAESAARSEAAAAEQVAGFLETVFRVANPGESRGNAVTARELLDHAAHRIAAHGRGTTHWEGCENHHNDCAFIKEIRAFLAKHKEQP